MLFTTKNDPKLISISNNQEVTDCPNCWGYSEWEGMDCTITFSIDKGSRSEIFSRNGFIRRFVKKYIG